MHGERWYSLSKGESRYRCQYGAVVSTMLGDLGYEGRAASTHEYYRTRDENIATFMSSNA